MHNLAHKVPLEIYNMVCTAKYAFSKNLKLVSNLFLQDGINWLAFLNKYKLHGILCDGILLVCGNMKLKPLLVVEYIRNKYLCEPRALPCRIQKVMQ